MNIQITDGFIWAVLDTDEAAEAFAENEVFILHDDGSESLIQSYAEFDEAIDEGRTLALEVGKEQEKLADWQEATTRNNDKRSFTAWLEDEAESLIY